MFELEENVPDIPYGMTLEEIEKMVAKKERMQQSRDYFHKYEELPCDKEVRVCGEQWWALEQLWADGMASLDVDDDE